MTSLGDAFPKEFKDGFASRNVKPGVVIKAFVPNTNPPKEKRFVLVGEKYDKLVFATVFINTEINANIFKDADTRQLHLPFDDADREYLDHPSFVDCSQLIFRDKSWLEKILAEDNTRLIGEVNQEDFSLIKKTIKSAKTISISHKKNFGLFL